jgi:glycosyltransferase involved in cell wall biosynthesis
MPKLWVVSEFYWPVDNATGYIITRIVDELAKSGDVNVLTVGKYDETRSSSIKCHRVALKHRFNKNILGQRILGQLVLSIKFFIALLKKIKRGDTILTVTNPALTLILINIIGLFKKVKIIIIVHDLFPENAIYADLLKEKSFTYKILFRLYKFIYSKSKLMIACGRDMERALKHKVKDPDKVIFIPNFTNTTNIYPVPKQDNPIIKNLHLEDKFVVIYTGNIGRMQGIEVILEAARILKNDDIHFIFIGEGAKSEYLMNYLRQHNLLNVSKLPNMPKEKSLDFLNAGDVGIVSLKTNINGSGVPSKTYSYMAAGKPIIALLDESSEIAEMVNEYNLGWVIEPENFKRLADVLKSIKDRRSELDLMACNVRDTAIKFYSEEVILPRFSEAILSSFRKHV